MQQVHPQRPSWPCHALPVGNTQGTSLVQGKRHEAAVVHVRMQCVTIQCQYKSVTRSLEQLGGLPSNHVYKERSALLVNTSTRSAPAAHLAHVKLKVVHNGSQGVTLANRVVVTPAIYALKRRQKPPNVACPWRV
jgi:hypothetical protein